MVVRACRLLPQERVVAELALSLYYSTASGKFYRLHNGGPFRTVPFRLPLSECALSNPRPILRLQTQLRQSPTCVGMVPFSRVYHRSEMADTLSWLILKSGSRTSVRRALPFINRVPASSGADDRRARGLPVPSIFPKSCSCSP